MSNNCVPLKKKNIRNIPRQGQWNENTLLQYIDEFSSKFLGRLPGLTDT